LLREGAHNGLEPRLPLRGDGLLFRVKSAIYVRLYIRVDRYLHAAADSGAALEPEIMSDTKGPAAKIAARFFVDKMLKECEEHFLHDFLAVVDAQSGRERVTKESVPPSLE